MRQKMKNNELITVDRTSLNMKLATINYEMNCDKYQDLILYIDKIIEKEKKDNRPIMEVELTVELVQILFPNKEIHKHQLFCNI